MTNQMVYTLQVKKTTPITMECRNRFVKNDYMIFLMHVQIGYFLTRFASKKLPSFLVMKVLLMLEEHN